MSLVNHQYGNYLLQHILDRANNKDAEGYEHNENFLKCNVWLHEGLKTYFGWLSRQKYSSNVVEKCLGVKDRRLSIWITKEILQDKDKNIPSLLRCGYGNYVLQAVLGGCSDPELKPQLIESIKQYVVLLRPNIKKKWQRLIETNQGESGEFIPRRQPYPSHNPTSNHRCPTTSSLPGHSSVNQQSSNWSNNVEGQHSKVKKKGIRGKLSKSTIEQQRSHRILPSPRPQEGMEMEIQRHSNAHYAMDPNYGQTAAYPYNMQQQVSLVPPPPNHYIGNEYPVQYGQQPGMGSGLMVYYAPTVPSTPVPSVMDIHGQLSPVNYIPATPASVHMSPGIQMSPGNGGYFLK